MSIKINHLKHVYNAGTIFEKIALYDINITIQTGEFIGPPGPQGLPGEKGDTGKTGNTGERGSKWMRGTAITGIDSNGVEFPNSDIENALAGDFFINTSTNDIYECVKSGNPSTAKWAYIGNIKGNKGDRGDVGPQGTVENIDDQILTFELAENLENVKSGETVKIAFGKLMKAVGAFIVHHTQKATTSILGHIKITNSAAVTDSTGLALAATEKNAAISGTLAHQIAQISAQNNDFANNISQLNSNMNKLMVANFGNVLDAYGIGKSTIFNNMTELNAALPINIHTICTINTDITARQIVNAVPIRYGILEIIKGYNDGFCTFILYGSLVEETYILTSRLRDNLEELGKWRKVMWEYIN